MALTVDGIRIPAHVQAQGNDAIEAYVRDLKSRVGLPHPAPKLEPGETAAARAEQWAPKLAQVAELQAKEQAEAEKIIVTKGAPIVVGAENPPPVARAQHRAQPAPKPAESPAPEPPAK